MDEKRPIILDQALASWRWTKIFVEEASAAIVLAICSDLAVGKIYNVGEAETLTEAEWVGAIGEVVNWQGELVIVPSEKMPEKFQMPMNLKQQFVSDASLIRAELGYKAAISRATALERTIAWERENPPEDIPDDQFDYVAEDELLKQLAAEKSE